MKALGNCLAQVIIPVILIFFIYMREESCAAVHANTLKHIATACSLCCPFQGPIPAAAGKSRGGMAAGRGNLGSCPAAANLKGAAAEEEMCWVIGRILGQPDHKEVGRKMKTNIMKLTALICRDTILVRWAHFTSFWPLSLGQGPCRKAVNGCTELRRAILTALVSPGRRKKSKLL